MRAKQLLIVGFGLPVVCNSEKKPQPDDEIGDGTKCSLFRCKCGGDGQLGNEGDKYTGDNNINKISEEGEEQLNEEDKKEFDNAINELNTLGKDVTGYNYSNTKLENLKNILKQEKKSFVEKINDVIFITHDDLNSVVEQVKNICPVANVDIFKKTQGKWEKAMFWWDAKSRKIIFS